MFERFSAGARLTVIRAQEEAVRLRHHRVGTEHLLLALTLAERDDPARTALEQFGLSHALVEDQLRRIAGREELDASALASVGVDLEEVRRRVEAQFGPGALEEEAPTRRARWLRRSAGVGGGAIAFSDDARLALELGLREALALQHRTIGSGHLLLGLLRGATGLGLRIITAQGVEPGLLRTRVAQLMRSSA